MRFSEKIVSEEKEEIEKLEVQTSLLSSDEVTEDQLQDILKQIQGEEAIDDQKEAEHNDWLAKREAKILEIKKILTTTTIIFLYKQFKTLTIQRKKNHKVDTMMVMMMMILCSVLIKGLALY